MFPIKSMQDVYIETAVKFFLNVWKSLLMFGLLGFLSALIYVLKAPKQYEAIAQIQMPQIYRGSNYRNENNNNNLGGSVEDPNLLLARMKIPTSYSNLNVKACGLERSKSPAEVLTSLAQFSLVKGVSTSVELKIRMDSKDQAVACAESIFENIQNSQNQILKPYIDEAKNLLTKYQARLEDARMTISYADKNSADLSAVYLINRDEVKLLLDESIRLNNFISSSEAHQARLVSPIYASDKPVSPRKKVALIVGFLLGLFIGFIYVIVKKALMLARAHLIS